jgi:hypothetical protein
MEFKLGDKVNAKKNTRYNSPDHKGIIVTIAYANGVGGEIYCTVRGANNLNYSYQEKDLSLCKTQKLYAYLDSTEEVHWATKNYTSKELTQFGLTRCDKFDKVIDLE